jgi:hypothetical protein
MCKRNASLYSDVYLAYIFVDIACQLSRDVN